MGSLTDRFGNIINNFAEKHGNLINRTAKDNLARLMAGENLTIEHKAGIKTASFDFRNRALSMPIIENVSREFNDLMIGHEVGHALNTPDLKTVLPPLIQSIDPSNPKGVAQFFNVVEDARVERRIKDKFPGLKTIFNTAYKEAADKNMFGVKGMDLNKLSLIDRINLNFKMGAAAGIMFNDAERALVDQVAKANTWDDVVECVRNIYEYSQEESQTSQDESDDDQEQDGDESDNQNGQGKKSKNKKNQNNKDKDQDESEGDQDQKNQGDKSKDKNKNKSKDKGDQDEGEGDDDDSDGDDGDQEGQNKSDKNQGKNKSKNKGNDDGEGEGDSDEGEGDSDGQGQDQQGNSNGKGKGQQGQGDQGDGDSEGNNQGQQKSNQPGQSKGQSSGGKGAGSAAGAGRPVPASLTDEAFGKSREALVAEAMRGEIQYLNVPKHIACEDFIIPASKFIRDFEPYVNDRTRQSAKTFRDASNKTISFMVKEFDMKKAADAYSRESVSRTGVINTSLLHTYKFNDDIFKRITTIPKGKNHGVMAFIDWSGSMSDNIAGTIEQLLTIVLFCKRVQIPFEIFAFQSGPGAVTSKQPAKTKYLANDIQINGFNMLQFISSSMKLADYNKAFNALIQLRDFYQSGRGNSYYGGSASGDRGFGVPGGYGLGGTPLNSSVLAAMDAVAKFRNKNKLQIVNTIFLSDGDSEAISAFTAADGRTRQSINGRGAVVIRDPITKTEIATDGGSTYSATKALLEILKERTGTNTFGFYLIPKHKGTFDSILQQKIGAKYVNHALCSEAWNKFCDEKAYYEKGAGFDGYYLLPGGDDLRVKDAGRFNTNAKTTDAIVQAFAKHQNQKTVNRKMLTEFITKMAK